MVFCISQIQGFSTDLHGHLYSIEASYNGIQCQVRAYFEFVGACGIFYSNSLQAVYRLCRIIYRTKQWLQSFKLYLMLIIILWILFLLGGLLISLLGCFVYLNDYYLCALPTTNIVPLLVIGTIEGTVPMVVIIGCYGYTLKRMRRDTDSLIQTMTQIQLNNARRDLIVLFRICSIVGLLTTSILPAFITTIMYFLTHYLFWWSYLVSWYTFSFTTTVTCFIWILISPHIQSLWKPNRVHPHGTLFNQNTTRNN